MDIKKEFERWLVNATADADVAAELKMLDDTKIEDASLTEEKVEKHKELLYSPVTEDNAKKFIELLMQ